MRTKFKWGICLLLAAMMALPLGAAGETAIVYDDPAKISAEIIRPTFWLFNDKGYTGDEIIWQTIGKYTNIYFQPISIPLANYEEKLATTIAGGDIPDIMGLRSYRTVDEYGPVGAFLSFEPYIEAGLMSNYVSVLESKPPAMTLATSPDGNRYSAPRIYATPRMDRILLTRIDVLEKLGLTREPQSFDELYDILAALKAAYPDSTPLFSRWGTENLLSSWGIMMDTDYTYYLGPGAGGYVYGPDTQNWKDLLSFLARLYKDGLLNKDFATLSEAEWEQLILNDRGFMTLDYQTADGQFKQYIGKELPEDFNWNTILPPPYEGKRPGFVVLEGYYGYVKAIAAQSEYKDELIRFIDWTYSEQGQQALMFGILGETYELGDKGEINFLVDVWTPRNLEGKITDQGLNDQQVFSVLPGNAAEFWENVSEFDVATKQYITEHDAWRDPVYNARFYNADENSQYTDIKTAADTYILEMSTKVITGEMSIDEWDDVIATAKSTYNVEEGLALINKAYNDTFNK